MSTRPDQAPPSPADVVLLGLSPTGLAVARSLSGHGIRVVGVDEQRTPASRSRHLAFRHAPITGDRAWVAFLTTLRREFTVPPVLLWTSDVHAETVARIQSQIRGHYRFITADADVVDGLASKVRFADLARRHALPVPSSRTLSELDPDAPAPVPCVLKPDMSVTWNAEVLAARGIPPSKVIAVDDAAGFEEMRRRLGDLADHVIVQDMVVGPDENHLDYHALIDADGTVRGEFVGRKLRLAPPHFGLGTFVMSEHDEEVVQAGRRVLSAVGYVGVANINFKRDARTGSLHLLEINPRFSLWTGLDVDCGIDLPYWSYLAALGTPPVETGPGYPRGRLWIHWMWDLATARRTATTRGWLLGWVRDAVRADVDAVASLRDPLPTLAGLADALRRRVGKH